MRGRPGPGRRPMRPPMRPMRPRRMRRPYRPYRPRPYARRWGCWTLMLGLMVAALAVIGLVGMLLTSI